MKVTIQKFFIEMTLPFIMAWFLMTVLVDIVTIPTVFRNSSSIVDAGKIGMKVFGTFNVFETMFGLMVSLGAVYNFSRNKSKKWLYFALPLLVWACIYRFHMTPMITETTYAIHGTAVADPMYAILQSKHAYYHNMYRYMDTAKLIFLLIFAGVVLVDRVRAQKENV